MMDCNFDVLSPDGLPLSGRPFARIQDALDFIPLWCNHYVQRGYYPSIRGNIPATELWRHVSIILTEAPKP